MTTIVTMPYAFEPPKGLAGLKKVYGDFRYTELSKGQIDIDDTWERDNLVTLRNVCGTGCTIQLHHLVAPNFTTCLTEAMRRVPKYRVRMLGGHSARHQMHNPKLPLSTHSWGCAFDINWDKNPVSRTLVTDLPREFIAAFTEQGWEWGGAWKSTKDAMHFQFATGI
jgi:hypothetical protein